LLWDMVKTLFYAHPIFVGPPAADEQRNVNSIGKTNGLRPVSYQYVTPQAS
jgi:hypothetical protein